MQEKRGEIVKFQGVVQTIPSYQQLVKANRVLLYVVFLLMLAVIVLGFFLVPNAELVLGNKKTPASDATLNEANPVVSSEINALKGQMIGLVSGSIESKLRNLEQNIKSGSAQHALGTIEDLKTDLKTLRSYSEPSPSKPKQVVSNQDLAKEINHLKDLIYMSLASCGLMFAAAAGVWVKYRKRLPFKEEKVGFLGKH